MTPPIRTSHERARGCGYRQKGGLYLVGGDVMEPCDRLPLPLEVCSVCGQGIKPTRGFAWIDPLRLFGAEEHGSARHSKRCYLTTPPERAGLIWIGGAFYTPREFTREAAEMGVSRRLAQIPKGLEVGKTLVLIAHRDVPKGGGEGHPAIFTAFVPKRIEYIVKGDETDEELERLVKRGIELVDVVPVADQQEMTAR